MKDQIRERFQSNLERVRALVQLYRAGVGEDGRTPVHQADVLRAAVVFLHATLEDVVRSALEWKLPSAPAEHLEAVPMIGCERRSRFTLTELARHRGKSVDQVIRASVKANLAESNFNHPGDLHQALRQIGMDAEASLGPCKASLASMMRRRHWIVHRADCNDEPGAGEQTVRSIGTTAVEGWRDAVESFGSALLAGL